MVVVVVVVVVVGLRVIRREERLAVGSRIARDPKAVGSVL